MKVMHCLMKPWNWLEIHQFLSACIFLWTSFCLHQTSRLLRKLHRSSFKIKSLVIGHSLLPWQPINGGKCLAKNLIKEANFPKNFSDSSQLMLNLVGIYDG